MTVRPQVQQLVDLGEFPSSSEAEESDIGRRGEILTSIKPPITNEEALALMTCFGPGEAFGLAWSLLHLIETTPGGVPFTSEAATSQTEWIRRLWDRSHR